MLKEEGANNKAMNIPKQVYSNVLKTKGIWLISMSCFLSKQIDTSICIEGEKHSHFNSLKLRIMYTVSRSPVVGMKNGYKNPADIKIL